VQPSQRGTTHPLIAHPSIFQAYHIQHRYHSSTSRNHHPLAEADIHILKQFFFKARYFDILSSGSYPLAETTIHALKLTLKKLR